MIVRFLAVLELFKQGVVDLAQIRDFGELVVRRLAEGERVLDDVSLDDWDDDVPRRRSAEDTHVEERVDHGSAARDRSGRDGRDRAGRAAGARAARRDPGRARSRSCAPSSPRSTSARAAASRSCASRAATASRPIPTWRRTSSGSCSKARPSRLSAPALETLAIVAYKQPISRAQLVGDPRRQRRGDARRRSQQRGYVEEVGRDPGPGQAVLYGTTPLFLERLGLDSLARPPAARRLRARARRSSRRSSAGCAPHRADDEPSDDRAPTTGSRADARRRDAPSGADELTEPELDRPDRRGAAAEGPRPGGTRVAAGVRGADRRRAGHRRRRGRGARAPGRSRARPHRARRRPGRHPRRARLLPAQQAGAAS